MSNKYFNHNDRLVPFSSARAEDVNDIFDAVSTGFEQADLDIAAAEAAADADRIAAEAARVAAQAAQTAAETAQTGAQTARTGAETARDSVLNDLGFQVVSADLAGPDTIGVVATNIANVNTTATNIANVNTTATNIANVNTTATNIANVGTVATNIANVNLTGGSIANVNATGGSIANVNTVATNIASVNTAATNIASINTAATNIADINAAPGAAAAALASELKAADWAEKPTAVEVGQFSAKYWAGQAQATVAGDVINDAETGLMTTWSSQKINEGIAAADAFPPGTKMLFAQTAAPVGWVKSIDHDNKALRVVSGTAGSGGTIDFTTAFGTSVSVTGSVGSTTAGGSVSTSTGSSSPSGTVSGTVGSTTLTSDQMPSHAHFDSTGDTGTAQSGTGRSVLTGRTLIIGQFTGGGGSHTHGFSGSVSLSSHSHTASSSFTGTAHNHTWTGSANMNVSYVDVIIATKE